MEKIVLIGALVAAVLVAGCGGGGSSSPTPAKQSNMSVTELQEEAVAAQQESLHYIELALKPTHGTSLERTEHQLKLLHLSKKAHQRAGELHEEMCASVLSDPEAAERSDSLGMIALKCE